MKSLIKKLLVNFQIILEFFMNKNFQKAIKNMVLGSGIRYPESGIRKIPIPDHGSRMQGSKRHRIPDRIQYTEKMFAQTDSF